MLKYGDVVVVNGVVVVIAVVRNEEKDAERIINTLWAKNSVPFHAKTIVECFSRNHKRMAPSFRKSG